MKIFTLSITVFIWIGYKLHLLKWTHFKYTNQWNFIHISISVHCHPDEHTWPLPSLHSLCLFIAHIVDFWTMSQLSFVLFPPSMFLFIYFTLFGHYVYKFPSSVVCCQLYPRCSSCRSLLCNKVYWNLFLSVKHLLQLSIT